MTKFKKLAYFPNTEKTRKRVFMDNSGNRFVKWTLETRIRKVNDAGHWFTVMIMEDFEDTFENYKHPMVHKTANQYLLYIAYIHLLQYVYDPNYNMIDQQQISEMERMGHPEHIKATNGK